MGHAEQEVSNAGPPGDAPLPSAAHSPQILPRGSEATFMVFAFAKLINGFALLTTANPAA